MKTGKLKEIIDYAVFNEVEAYDFYRLAAEKAQDKGLKSIFSELAEEELKHKKFLEEFLENDTSEFVLEEFNDYKLSEKVDKPELSIEMKFVDAIALAMKKEEEAMILYQGVAGQISNEEHKKIFLNLAKMEQLHKARLEEIYTNAAYAEVW